jgi:hypothetical protein
MSIGNPIRSYRPSRPVPPGLAWQAVRLAQARAAVLGHPTVLTLLRPIPVKANLSGFGEDPPAPSAWDSANKAIQSLSTVVGAGTNFYAGQQQTKLLQQQADAAAARTEAAQRAADTEKQYMLETQRAAALAAATAPKGMPSWVLPVAIGGVLIAALGGYFIFKKKAASP